MITATAKFTPSGDTRRLLDLFVQVKLFSAVQRSQAIVADEARALCPTNTGELQGSIAAGEITNDGQRIIGPVRANAPYASFVEFGTGVIGSGTYPFDLPQQGVPFTGSWVYDYKQQNWQGKIAQPYLRPALDMARAQVLAEFQQ